MTQGANTQEKPVIQSDLVMLDLDCKTSEEVIRTLSNSLLERGWVKEGFLQAILEREKEYPTGLPTGGAAVAIPHTNAEFVLKSAMVTAILKEPVLFQNMADPDEALPVRIVFLLAMKEPAFQVLWLKQLMGLLGKPDLLQKLLVLDDREKITVILNELIKPT
jgi:PTS system galactitol-specific IIA component